MLRDVVNYIAMKGSELSNEKGIFNSKIIEIEGFTNELTVEGTFELSASVAKRSAAGCTIDLAQDKIFDHLKRNVDLMRSMIDSGYENKSTIKNRLKDIENWLANPELLRCDANAEFSDKLEIDLSEIKEPVIAAPNNPDNACWLSEHQSVEIDEVFIGSCMTNIEHFKAVARVITGKKVGVKKL